jgi:hypothetical protein
MASTTDDGFLAEGFVWEGEVPGAVEIVETSSVQTMRRLLGTQSEGGLILDEVPAERATRVRLDFVGTDSLRLQEITLRTQPPRAFVDEMFLRVAR